MHLKSMKTINALIQNLQYIGHKHITRTIDQSGLSLLIIIIDFMFMVDLKIMVNRFVLYDACRFQNINILAEFPPAMLVGHNIS